MLKKFINIFLYFFIFTLTYTYSIQDYLLFQSGKVDFLNKDYSLAELKFSTYRNNFKNSAPLVSNYGNFYFGMNYYYLKNYPKAIFYLTQGVYIPKNHYMIKNPKFNFFQYKRDFYLGKSYYEIKDFKKGDLHFKNLILNYYSPELGYFEKQALEILEKNNIYYSYIKEIKYYEDFTNISKVKTEDLISIGDFFISKNDYINSLKIFGKLYPNFYKNQSIKFKYALSLLKNKEYLKVINLTQNLEIYGNDNLFYLRGKAFEELRNFSAAIDNFSKVKFGEYKHIAFEEKVNLYYILGEHYKVISLLKNHKDQNFDEKVLFLNSYIHLRNKNQFLNYSENFIQDYPYTFESGVYSLIRNNLINNNKNPWDISDYNSFYLINLIVNSYVNNLKPYRENSQLEKKEIELQGLFKIAQLQDEQLLILAINNNELGLVNSDTNTEITKSAIYASGKFYDLALENSQKQKNIFYQYSNLIHYLFPKYYEKKINYFCKLYDIPNNLVYSIILSTSKFKSDYYSTDYKIGLMALTPDFSIPIENLLNPDTNLNLGIEKLSEIYNKNKGDTLKTLIEYTQGKEILNSIFFEKDGDIDLNKIKDIPLRKNIQSLMYNYAFYNSLYN